MAQCILGEKRDFAWNLVAWTSFSAVSRTNGVLQFYASGDSGVLFAKRVAAVGLANNASATSPCLPRISTSFNKLDHILRLQADLNIGDSCVNPPCQVNPCPGVFSPQSFGYKINSATTSIMNVRINNTIRSL